jgi:hypothetical protein
MGLVRWLPWHRSGASSPAGADVRPAPTVRSVGGWRSVPAIQRAVGAPSLVSPPGRLEPALLSWRDPSLLGPLGHVVDPHGPAGRVHDAAVTRTPVETSAEPAGTDPRDGADGHADLPVAAPPAPAAPAVTLGPLQRLIRMATGGSPTGGSSLRRPAAGDGAARAGSVAGAAWTGPPPDPTGASSPPRPATTSTDTAPAGPSVQRRPTGSEPAVSSPQGVPGAPAHPSAATMDPPERAGRTPGDADSRSTAVDHPLAGNRATARSGGTAGERPHASGPDVDGPAAPLIGGPAGVPDRFTSPDHPVAQRTAGTGPPHTGHPGPPADAATRPAGGVPDQRGRSTGAQPRHGDGTVPAATDRPDDAAVRPLSTPAAQRMRGPVPQPALTSAPPVDVPVRRLTAIPARHATEPVVQRTAVADPPAALAPAMTTETLGAAAVRASGAAELRIERDRRGALTDLRH